MKYWDLFIIPLHQILTQNVEVRMGQYFSPPSLKIETLNTVLVGLKLSWMRQLRHLHLVKVPIWPETVNY